MNVIIAGGGTGGHIFPALAIGHAVMRHYPEAKILYVGANGKMEMEKVPQEGFDIVGLDIAGFNRSQIWKNISLPWKLWKSNRDSIKILKSFQPDIAIGVGGYASFPVLRAAQSLGIPTLIQEQNSHAGKSNIILGKKAKRICVAFDGMDKFFEQEKVIKTGNPVRTLISQSTKTNLEGKAAFQLNPAKKTILIVGGSLGAMSINEAIFDNLDKLTPNCQILWQTGKPYFESAKRVEQEDVKVYDFIRNMDDAYAAADIIISRAGAMAISELCIVGKPVIFVPYPFASEDHQTVNAQSLVKVGAAEMVKNSDAKIHLTNQILALLNDDNKCQQLANNIKKLEVLDADERIVKEIKTIVNPH